MNIHKLRKSFIHAYHGLRKILIKENSFKFMLVISLGVIILMFVLPTTKIEKIILLILCLIVLGFEMFNTLFEKLLDWLHPNENENIRDLKDLSAAIVLFVSIIVGILGLIILLPYVFKLK